MSGYTNTTNSFLTKYVHNIRNSLKVPSYQENQESFRRNINAAFGEIKKKTRSAQWRQPDNISSWTDFNYNENSQDSFVF